jgi:NUDIX domain
MQGLVSTQERLGPSAALEGRKIPGALGKSPAIGISGAAKRREKVLWAWTGRAGGRSDKSRRVVGPVRRLSLEHGDSVAAVVFHRDRRSMGPRVAVSLSTHDKGPGWLPEILAGMIDAGESPEEALRREVREEGGYEIERLDSIGTVYLSPGGSSERIIIMRR